MERIRVLDVLRGIAILGILLANIEAFGRAQLEPELNPASVVLTYSEEILEGFRAWFVSGKFRSLLAILFGIGLWMQYEKLSKTGEWPGVYIKRTLILFVIGLTHLLFIWFGDILTIYAVVALLALAMVKLPERVLWVLIWSFGWISLLFGLVVAFAASSAGGNLDDFGSFGQWLTVEKETWAFAEGPWGVQFLYRLGMGLMSALSGVIALFDLLPLFLFGIILGQRNYLQKSEDSPGITRWGIGLGVLGLILNAVPLLMILNGQESDFTALIEFGLGGLMSVGFLVLMTQIFRKVKRGWIWRPFELVGRTALSCYLMQSVICTFVFYSFGLGLFGSMDRFEILVVVPLVWLANILFAAIWLQFFTMGPVEYVWRSWVDGKWRSLRRLRA